MIEVADLHQKILNWIRVIKSGKEGNCQHQPDHSPQLTSQLHVKHEDRNIALVNKSIDKMFEHFPPKPQR